mmetsp:Transcript_89496/g.186973  ORF Transcript_89496/g.186973 Transcript_89496/m.186973 type:complete len:330 (+) Transcript_89496:88-1077(+)
MLLRCVKSNCCCPKVRDDGSSFQDKALSNQLYSNPFLNEDAALKFGILDSSVDFPDDAMNLMYDPTNMGNGHDGDMDELAEEITDEQVHDVDDFRDNSPLDLEHHLSPVKAPINTLKIGGHFLPMSSEVKTASGAPLPHGLAARARYASAPATYRRNPSRPGRPGLPASPALAAPRCLGVQRGGRDRNASPSPSRSYQNAYLESPPRDSFAAPVPPAPPPRSLTSRVGAGVGLAPGQPMPPPLPPSTSFEAHMAGSPAAPPHPSTLMGSPGGGFARVGEAPGVPRTQQADQLEAGAASIAAILQCVAQSKELTAQQKQHSEHFHQRWPR